MDKLLIKVPTKGAPPYHRVQTVPDTPDMIWKPLEVSLLPGSMLELLASESRPMKSKSTVVREAVARLRFIRLAVMPRYRKNSPVSVEFFSMENERCVTPLLSRDVATWAVAPVTSGMPGVPGSSVMTVAVGATVELTRNSSLLFKVEPGSEDH